MLSLQEALDGPVWEVAPRLLGWTLETRTGGGVTSVWINEVEAYDQSDPASHTFRGLTPRCASMFLGAGHIYVYRSYGIHWCVNFVAGREGHGAGILLRGGEPDQGREIMEQRRGRSDHLTDGPGKLSQALGITGDLDGHQISDGGPVRIVPPPQPIEYAATLRIGISQGADKPWRFVAR